MHANNECQRDIHPGATPYWRLACLLSLCGIASLADETGTSQSALAFLTCCCVFLIRNRHTRSAVNTHQNPSPLTGIAWVCAIGNVAGTIGSALLAFHSSTVSSPDGAAISISALALMLCFALIRSPVGEKPGSVLQDARTALEPTTAKLITAACVGGEQRTATQPSFKSI